MGQSESKSSVKKKVARPPPSFGKKPNINKEDYIFSKRKDESLVKQQGSISGQQFIIEESSGCDMFLLDHIACVTVDLCDDCRIVTGPIESSIFIRNCNNCVIYTVCQQLRVRDCTNLKIYLCSTTGPIIETSRHITFGCYNYNYFGLTDHFRAAGLSVWNNAWHEVYDFNPVGGDGNFRVEPDSNPTDSLPALIPAITKLGLEAQDLAPSPRLTRLVPPTYGSAKSLIIALEYSNAASSPPSLASHTATVCIPVQSPANVLADTEEAVRGSVVAWLAQATSEAESTGRVGRALCRTLLREFSKEQLETLGSKEWASKVTGGLLVLELFAGAPQLSELLTVLRSRISSK